VIHTIGNAVTVVGKQGVAAPTMMENFLLLKNSVKNTKYGAGNSPFVEILWQKKILNIISLLS